MLKQLSVSNFALIEKIRLNLESGFTVVTGETGSGKSILLGALRLILGERADYSVIRDTNKKTFVEATFQLEPSLYVDFFKNQDLDFYEETIIRREINTNGKSRAFINDTPVQLSVLKELTEQLIYIHSQHHTLALKNKDFQREILDVVAGNQKLLIELKKLYTSIKSLSREISALEDSVSRSKLEADFNAFQIEELSQLHLDKIDYAQIKLEAERGEQFEEIKMAYQKMVLLIQEEEGAVDKLYRIRQEVKVNDPKISELLDRIHTVIIELKDIGDMAESDLSELSFDPSELIDLLSKLDAFNSALQKHNLTSQEELVELYNRLSDEILESDNLEFKISEKKQELFLRKEEANVVAQDLTERRKKSAQKIEREVQNLLGHLKLDGAKISFAFEETELSASGCDLIQMYFAPNKGIAPQVIEKSASGGELSRLMLAIQFILSKSQQLPTLIFDEIDTGVSGEVAQRIGTHLKNMGSHLQLIAITHLPQVASKGEHHILVEKKEVAERTQTFLKILNKGERIEEIAKLMSGNKVNEAAILNAKNLMNE